ncbi:phospholipase D-like domain-containing protein [Streptomyces lichenis]|uniref:phospholipase D-like domain-containing protein n=1 Tax=Streptomyces lichenis TaxID=2306967 RepID=UPI003557B630
MDVTSDGRAARRRRRPRLHGHPGRRRQWTVHAPLHHGGRRAPGPAEVWRTKEFDGRYVRNHTKFPAIDHHLLLVTSANFSWSAENNNVEFGVLIDNPNLTEAVERELREAQEVLYEQISSQAEPGPRHSVAGPRLTTGPPSRPGRGRRGTGPRCIRPPRR